jgi:hypothetical protein
LTAPDPPTAPAPDAGSEPDTDEAVATEVTRKAADISRNRGRRTSLARTLAMVGVLGWVFILPLVGLTYLGHHLGRAMGSPVPSVVGLLAGLTLGAYLLYRNVSAALRASEDGAPDERT